jgi:hypothetical protein
MEELQRIEARKAAVPPIKRYDLDVQPRRRPDWTASQGELTGYAWIDRFSKLADNPDADCGFVKRKVFFTIEHGQSRVAAGSDQERSDYLGQPIAPRRETRICHEGPTYRRGKSASLLKRPLAPCCVEATAATGQHRQCPVHPQ